MKSSGATLNVHFWRQRTQARHVYRRKKNDEAEIWSQSGTWYDFDEERSTYIFQTFSSTKSDYDAQRIWQENHFSQRNNKSNRRMEQRVLSEDFIQCLFIYLVPTCVTCNQSKTNFLVQQIITYCFNVSNILMSQSLIHSVHSFTYYSTYLLHFWNLLNLKYTNKGNSSFMTHSWFNLLV